MLYSGVHRAEAPAFRILNAENPAEYASWVEQWKNWPGREVFAHPGYARLFASSSSRALCACMTSDLGTVLFPFILRDLSIEPYWVADLPDMRDIVSPYGYGGPFFWGGSAAELAQCFWPIFDKWATTQGVVSEFIRFHLVRSEILSFPGAECVKQFNVVRSLDLDEAALWSDFEQKVRKNVKRAQREGVVIERDPTGERLDEFLQIYHGTMNRRGASRGYYFPRTFFRELGTRLEGHFMYFHAVLEGQVISTELVLLSSERVYSFLGGTDERYFDMRPNDLLKYEIMQWARLEGKRSFVLGGGYEEGDGVYRYKRSFAPEGAVPFLVGERVLQPEAYDCLVRKRREQAEERGERWDPRPGFFPEYRA